MSSKFSIIPTHDGVCVILPKTMTATIDIRDESACEEVLNLGGELGQFNEEGGFVPIIFRHGEIAVRAFDFRESTLEELRSFSADVEKIKAEVENEFKKRVEARRGEIMNNLCQLPDNVEPITKSL